MIGPESTSTAIAVLQKEKLSLDGRIALALLEVYVKQQNKIQDDYNK